MARLNPASPTKPADLRPRQTKTTSKISRSVTATKRESGDSATVSQDKAEKEQWALTDEIWSKSRSSAATDERPPQRKNRPQRAGTVSSTTFNIFSESDGEGETEDSSRSSLSSQAQSTTDPLRLSHVNSLLIPLSQQPRTRPPRKSVGLNYDKENDPIDGEEQEDEGSSLSRNSSNASNRSPTRRNVPQAEARGEPQSRILRYRQQEIQSEDEASEDNDSDSMDDFIVSDNEEPSFHETSADEISEDEEKLPTPSPPRTRKRLVRGRRPAPEIDTIGSQGSSPEQSSQGIMAMQVPRLEPKPQKLFQKELGLSDKLNGLKIDDNGVEFQPAKTPHGGPREEGRSPTTQATIFGTPPSSPSKGLLRSPTKSRVHIPPTPHRESVEGFWSQEATNDWVDQHSPCKIDTFLQEFDESEAEAIDIDIMPRTRVTKTSPTKTPSKTALKKAEALKKKTEKALKQEFDEKKDSMAKEFLKVLDDTVNEGEIHRIAATGDGVPIVWSRTLQTTAGRANWKRITPPAKSKMPPRHHVKIELAERIIINEDRLIKTLAHEYCHLANYMISDIQNNPHGESFKQWARKCEESMKDHPVYGNQVQITMKHGYDIDYKYEWKCVDCCQVYGRHSRSINPQKSRCGRCQGKLQQIKPKPRNVSPQKKQAKSSLLTSSAKSLLESVAKVMDQENRKSDPDQPPESPN